MNYILNLCKIILVVAFSITRLSASDVNESQISITFRISNTWLQGCEIPILSFISQSQQFMIYGQLQYEISNGKLCKVNKVQNITSNTQLVDTLVSRLKFIKDDMSFNYSNKTYLTFLDHWQQYKAKYFLCKYTLRMHIRLVIQRLYWLRQPHANRGSEPVSNKSDGYTIPERKIKTYSLRKLLAVFRNHYDFVSDTLFYLRSWIFVTPVKCLTQVLTTRCFTKLNSTSVFKVYGLRPSKHRAKQLCARQYTASTSVQLKHQSKPTIFQVPSCQMSIYPSKHLAPNRKYDRFLASQLKRKTSVVLTTLILLRDTLRKIRTTDTLLKTRLLNLAQSELLIKPKVAVPFEFPVFSLPAVLIPCRLAGSGGQQTPSSNIPIRSAANQGNPNNEVNNSDNISGHGFDGAESSGGGGGNQEPPSKRQNVTSDIEQNVRNSITKTTYTIISIMYVFTYID